MGQKGGLGRPKMISAWTRGARSLVAGTGLVVALAAFGCGDNVTTPGAVPTPTPSAPAPTPTSGVVVLRDAFILPARSNLVHDFTTTRRGTLEVTVGYSSDDSAILFFVTNKPCTYWQFQRDQCDYLVRSLSGPNPRREAVSGVAAGAYSLILLNENKEAAESITLEVVLTPQ
jgi:hypothetical protein